MNQVSLIEYIGAGLFFIALLHSFSTKFFVRLAQREGRHAGLWHMLGEVEVVFGFWAFVLLGCMAAVDGYHSAVEYLDTRNFTEPLFVFAILVIAGTRPILQAAQLLIDTLDRLIPLPGTTAYYFLTLSIVPILGSFITEPAAMTLGAIILRDRYFTKKIPESMRYLTIAILLVNVSIGGVLTPYAAPPVLMVAGKWGWGLHHMLMNFGWKAVIAICLNAAIASVVFHKTLFSMSKQHEDSEVPRVPLVVMLIHLMALVLVVLFSHHPAVFMGVFLLFLGFTEAYRRYQSPLMLREGLLVAFFLAGLVVVGGMQKWWLEPILSSMGSTVLFGGTTLLTAITDNAALTYLGSLVEDLSDVSKYALLAGAVTGGGLTVIANAPNPVSFSVLQNTFENKAISPLGLFLNALVPTVIAACCFIFL